MVKGKEKFALWITPECKQLVDDCYADDQCQSRSEYIEEKAIWFYSGFLHAEKADRYPESLAADPIWNAGSICRAHWTAAFQAGS